MLGAVDGRGVSALFYFAISHSCAKAAMFLAAGTIFLQMGHDRIRDLAGVRQYLPKTSFAFALGGLSLMGLPPTGGFIAKYTYLNLAVSQQKWWLVVLIVTGSCLTAGYIYKAVAQILRPQIVTDHSPMVITASMEWSALLLACISILLGFIAPILFSLIEVAG